MPRQARVKSSTGTYHVMLRGVNKQRIFEQDDDYAHFIEIMHSVRHFNVDGTKANIPNCDYYAYCLMDNHIHMLIHEGASDIATVVKGAKEVETVMNRYIDIKKNRKSEEQLTNKQEDLIPIFEVCLEMFARGIRMLNIDINKSQATQFVADGDTILPPFTSLDGLGYEAAISIVNARNEKPFTSIADLQARTKLSTTLIGKLKDLNALGDLPVDDQLRLF